MINAFLALAAVGSTVAYGTATGGRFALISLGVGGLGVVLLAAGIVLRVSAFVPWSILATAAGYVGSRAGDHSVDGWAAVFGVLLLLGAELASWAIDHDARISEERALTVRRIWTLALLCATALLMNFLLLGTAAVSASASVVLGAAGVAAAIGSLVVVLRLTRRA